MRYLFEEYAFDTDRRELQRGTDAVSITPQVFDLLDYLIRNRERVVSKDDLVNAIWNCRSVSDAALTTRLNAARSAIGDSGAAQRLIKTLPRKGFRFIGTVREVNQRSGAAAILSRDIEFTEAPLPLPDKPSIAVLPFENMSGDAEQEYFADGIVEEIITALSRFKSLFVIARNSSFIFKGRAVDIKEVGRRLGVRYVLEGSVRKAAGKVRIAGQLIDAATGAHIWADRYERDLTDIFVLQDEITLAVVSAIQPKLLQTEIAMATRRRPENLTAYDLYLRAVGEFRSMTRESFAEATRLAHRALELDPQLGLAAGLAGNCHALNVVFGFAVDPKFERREALRLARLALSIDDSDADTLASASFISAIMIGAGQTEIEMANRAVALNPNAFQALVCRGHVYRIAGLPEEAIRSFEHAVRMSPLDPVLHAVMAGIGMALIELGRFEEAVEAGKKAERQNAFYSSTYRCLASAYAHLGRDAESREAAARLLELDAAFNISGWIARGGQSNAKLLIDGLRRAGLPE
ncbi:winged helix-turn-helix domain-containing protein [Bradyrhizobium sp. BRP19]|uniref:winged helix-turn-helix domain-containing tetratricopeptide repeat protein n=1 Tax=Bradyrhizobium sp. BRP19 TaxID=2793823 RepID=UPI001CD34F32|nr:winged helix-turn-helix domain-containing tetratricopeptide repeat protein [Bradyrhizobium sp. BRP19]MCA1549770.1 winged helix-turn-helix domain-containing protein [Bradyrhizobium sp. BRP19]